MSTDTRYARSLGEQFAEQLNQAPQERGNWSPLGPEDLIPEEDYLGLLERYGEENIDEAEQAYRDGFNVAYSSTTGMYP